MSRWTPIVTALVLILALIALLVPIALVVASAWNQPVLL